MKTTYYSKAHPASWTTPALPYRLKKSMALLKTGKANLTPRYDASSEKEIEFKRSVYFA